MESLVVSVKPFATLYQEGTIRIIATNILKQVRHCQETRGATPSTNHLGDPIQCRSRYNQVYE